MSNFLAVHLCGRDFGELRAEQFAILETQQAPLKPGQALIENIYLSVGAEAALMVRREWRLHTPMPSAPAVGRVLESRTSALPVGAVVRHDGGWSTHSVVSAGQADLEVVDSSNGIPPSLQLSVLGMPGLTAWVGVHEILRVHAEERVLVASAQSLTGRLVGQIARLYGAEQVIEGVMDSSIDGEGALSRGLFDAAWTDLSAEHLSWIVPLLRHGGRIASPEFFSAQPAEPSSTGPSEELSKIEVSTYRARSYTHRRETAHGWLRAQISAGTIAVPGEPTVQGFERIIEVFLAAVRERSTDPVIVQIAPYPAVRAGLPGRYSSSGLADRHC